MEMDSETKEGVSDAAVDELEGLKGLTRAEIEQAMEGMSFWAFAPETGRNDLLILYEDMGIKISLKNYLNRSDIYMEPSVLISREFRTNQAGREISWERWEDPDGFITKIAAFVD